MTHSQQSLPQELHSTTKADNANVERAGETLPTFRAAGRKLKRGVSALWSGRRVLMWLVLLAVVCHVSFNIWATVLLNRELAAIRQRGEPLTLTEMIPTVPDAQNAAPLYAKADAVLKLPQEISRSFSGYGGSRRRFDAATMRPILTQSQEAITLTRHAAAMPACRFPVKWDEPDKLVLAHYATMRRLAILLQYQAVQEAREGNMAAALADVHAIFHMSRHLSVEPVLLGVIQARAIESTGYAGLAEILDIAPITAQQAVAVKSALPTTNWAAAVHRGKQGERAYGLYYLELMRRTGAELDIVGVSLKKWGLLPSWSRRILHVLWLPFFKLDAVHYIRQFNKTVDNTPVFVNQRGAAAYTGMDSDELPWYAIVTKVLLPIFGNTSFIIERSEVDRRQAEIALALHLHRAATGQYPIKLQELSEGAPQSTPLPLDPYSNKPFVYHRARNAFLLYSIGRNGKDDGGKFKQTPPPDKVLDDLVWPTRLNGFKVAG